MKITLTDDEAKDTLVAVRMMGAANTALLSMSPSTEVRRMLLDTALRLGNIERKLDRGT